MTFETIRYEIQGQVAVITYNRPSRRNAWSVPMYREVVAAIEHANAAKEIGALVITNEGPVFCAGADINAPPEPMDPATGRPPTIGTLAMAKDHSWLHLMASSKPVIAAVNGAAVGAGVSHILSADIRIGSVGSSYAFSFLALNTLPEIGTTGLLARLVGAGRATDLCLSAATIDAAEALRIGLITRLVPPEQLVAEAIAVGGRIAGFDSLRVRLAKGLLATNALEGDLNMLLRREGLAFVAAFKAAGQATA